MSAPAPQPSPPADTAGAQRHVEAISHLFKEHNRTLVLYLAARLRDEQLAKEVAQEAYVKLLQLERPGAVSFLRSYLFRVASNLAIDRLRQQDSRTRIDQKDAFDDFIEDCMGERAAEAQDELAYVKRCLYELPPRYGQAFHLHALLELSFDEIAESMCIKPRMVRHYVTLSLVYVRLRREGVARDEAWKRIHRE